MYLMVLAVPAYPLGGGRFAVESAFAQHLRQLKRRLGPIAEDLVVATPRLPEPAYRLLEKSMEVLDEEHDRIRLVPLYETGGSHTAFLKEWPVILRRLTAEVRRAEVVHSGNSYFTRPVEFTALALAKLRGAKTIFVTDIDDRNSAKMNLESGYWGRRQYAVNRIFADTFMHLQRWIAARAFSLVLLKGSRLAHDYGRGRPNVKNFLDSAFNSEHLIPEEELERKLRAVTAQPAGPLEVIYFGRLVAYKGIDHMLRAVKGAREGGADVRFGVIGAGPEQERLEDLMRELGIADIVTFHGAMPFGERLFAKIRAAHVLLAAPLSEDTPRSALDAMAGAEVVVAYDTYYYKELADGGGGVVVVPWLDHEAMARELVALAQSRDRLAELMRRSVRFARANTQEIWLERRVEWTREIFRRIAG